MSTEERMRWTDKYDKNWLDFILQQISHEELCERIRRAPDPFYCPATRQKHTEEQGAPDETGHGACYCMDCGYRWSYRRFSQAERDEYKAKAQAWAANRVEITPAKEQGHEHT